MSSKFDRLIVLGITSSLASSFLKRFGSTFQSVVGFTRIKEKQSDSTLEFSKQHLKTISSYCRGYELKCYVDDGTDQPLIESLRSMLTTMSALGVLTGTGALYFSTEISTNVLRLLNQFGIQVLTIGSGAVIDWEKERQGFNIVKLAQSDKTAPFAKYIEGKILAERFSTATIHPGFYLPGKDDPFTGSGLHLDSCEKIFAPEFDPNFDWGKAKFVTPLSAITDFVGKWTRCSFTGSWMLGTMCAYPRWKLRELAGFTDVPQAVKDQIPFDNSKTYADTMKRT